VFDDSKHLVYGISVNEQSKVINLAFRGSVTVTDWVTDGDSFLVMHSNPLRSRTSNSIPQSKYIGIHAGFSHYMFGASKDSKSQYETILEHLATLFEQYPDYTLRVSGHSLGAALATLFTFQCGAEDKAPGLILCITFASPYVGDTAFFRAFQELMVAGKVRYLRVKNHKDLITTMPKAMWLLGMAYHWYPRTYRHVGVELRLFQDGKYRVHHPVVHRGRLRIVADDFARCAKSTCARVCCLVDTFTQNVIRWHSCSEYKNRLDQASTDFEGDVLSSTG